MESFSLVVAVGIVCVLLFHWVSFFVSSGRRRVPLPPGPRRWPVLGNLPQLGQKPHQSLADLSRKHGPLLGLRLGSVQVVVASSASTAAEFLKTHDTNFSSRPSSSALKSGYNQRDLVFTPYGPLWRALRRICSVHLLSSKMLDESRRLREEEAAALARNLRYRGDSGEVAAVGLDVNACVVNALARALMGRRLIGESLGGEADEFRNLAEEMMQLLAVFNIADFVPWLSWFDPQGVVTRMKYVHRRFDKMFEEIIKAHESTPGADKDMLRVMLAMRDEPIDADGTIISNTEIKGLLLSLFVGGTDTTTISVEWGMAELIRHPKILQTLRDEIDAAVGRDRLVLDSDLRGLPYLHAVVKEVLRLHHPGPLSVPRIAKESCEISGYYIPKGATLLVNFWAIFRDPDVWPSPLEFRPERFLPGGDHAGVDVKGADAEFIPFGAGRRICPGIGMGMAMVQLIMATLVHAFEWELPPGETAENLDMEESKGLSVPRAVPLRLRLVPRLDLDAYT